MALLRSLEASPGLPADLTLAAGIGLWALAPPGFWLGSSSSDSGNEQSEQGSAQISVLVSGFLKQNDNWAWGQNGYLTAGGDNHNNHTTTKEYWQR